MYATLGLVLLLVSCGAADNCTQMCDYNDEECLLKGANVEYKSAVEGVDGELPSIDPLHIDKLDDDTELSDIQFTGFRDCYVSVIRLHPSDETCEFGLHCPAVASLFSHLNERIKATAYDCDLYYRGNYGIFTKGDDQKRYFYIKYRNSTLLDYKEFKSVQTPVDEEEPAVLPEETIKSMVLLIVNKAMHVLMDHKDVYLSKYTTVEIFPDC